MICVMIGWLRRSCRRACRSGAPLQNTLWRGTAHRRGVLTRSSRRPTCETTRPPLPHLTTTTYLLYLLWHPVCLTLFLTVVILQVCLCLHPEGRPLTSAGSIPDWGDGPSYRFSCVGQLSLLLFLYLMHRGTGLRIPPRANCCKV